MEKQKILMIGEVNRFLFQAEKNMLEEKSYLVVPCVAEIDSVNKNKEDVIAILLDAGEYIFDNQKLLQFLKDRVIEQEISLFLIGYQEQLDEINKIIPRHLIKEEFKRPVNAKEVAIAIDTVIKKNEGQDRKKILVVDDSGAMLRSVKSWLEDRYHVDLANSGAMAIKYLSLNRPDLILLDYEMPVCSGKQVLEMIRSESEFSGIPVIFLTSKGDVESIIQVMALQPEGYLLKTLSPGEIIKAVDDFFHKQKTQKV